MKIAVIGAGAMGSIYGGHLSLQNEVWLVDTNQETVEHIQKNGLILQEEGQDITYHPSAVTSSEGLPPMDLVILFVKALYSRSALSANRELIGPDTFLMTLQNGSGHEDILSEFVPADHIIIGTTEDNGAVLAPGYVRRDEELDNLHSCYVDQWDWEKVITREERTVETLQETVRTIFKVIKHMQHEVWYKYPEAAKRLPSDITFVTTQELEDRWPDKSPKERENLITQEHGCVFLMKIGDKLKSGEPHDGRAPDYDDWQLNGDILFWFEKLGCALEISSMGIRVDETSLAEQLKKAGCEERKDLPYHKMLLNGELPCTIGGGIGQSRLCMLLLDRVHVGEVQASIWPEEMRKICREHNIILL